MNPIIYFIGMYRACAKMRKKQQNTFTVNININYYVNQGKKNRFEN